MAKVSTNIGLDEDLKKEAQELFGELGLDLTTAVTIFLKQSVREGRIPFAIHKYKPQAPVEMHYTAQPSQMMETFDEVARRMG